MLLVRPVVAPLLLRRSLPAAPSRLPSCCSRSFCAAAQASRFEREQQSYASEAPHRPWLPKPRKQPRKQPRAYGGKQPRAHGDKQPRALAVGVGVWQEEASAAARVCLKLRSAQDEHTHGPSLRDTRSRHGSPTAA